MAAYAFAAGAKEIWLVRTIEEARLLAQQNPGVLLMGEERGLRISGFDYSNSPTELVDADLTGRILVQRTGAGTQGAVSSSRSEVLLASSFVVAGATARHIQYLDPPEVIFVITGVWQEKTFGEYEDLGEKGDEDSACADYLEALLKGEKPAPQPYLRRVAESAAGRQFLDPSQAEFLAEDVDLCTRLDRFNFHMAVQLENEKLVMRRG